MHDKEISLNEHAGSSIVRTVGKQRGPATMCPPTNGPTHKWTHLQTDPPTNGPIYKWTHLQTGLPKMCPPRNVSTFKWTHPLMGPSTNGSTHKWAYLEMGPPTNRSIFKCVQLNWFTYDGIQQQMGPPTNCC